MEEKRQTQQDNDRAKQRKRRRIRNQTIVCIGVFAFVVAIAAATVPGVKFFLRGNKSQQEDQQAGWMQQGDQPAQETGKSVESPESIQQKTEKMEQVLTEKRPALVSLRGSEDGINYRTGSGFIVEIKEDVLFICTCGHVIESYDNWEIEFFDGTTVMGVKTGISQVYDVGVVEVSMEQLSEQLSKNLFALNVDLDHWSGLYDQTAYAGFVSMYREEGSDSYMTGQLVDVLADYPWGDLCQSEFQLAFVNGDSGAAIFDEDGMLISMVLGTSYDEGEDIPRRWGVPLSAIITCYLEIFNQRGGV